MQLSIIEKVAKVKNGANKYDLGLMTRIKAKWVVFKFKLDFHIMSCARGFTKNKRRVLRKLQLPKKFIISHKNPNRVRWEMLMILLALFNSILVPLELAFEGSKDSIA